MNVDSLSNLNLHDSEILELVVDRVDTNADKITLHLNYIENYESMEVSRKKIIFQRCYKAKFDMNFGVVAPESIRIGYEVEDSILVSNLRSRLEKVGIDIGDTLKHFRIETNSTGSVIEVLAERIELLDDIST